MDWLKTNGVVPRYDLSGTGPVPLLLMHELGGSLELRDCRMRSDRRASGSSAWRRASSRPPPLSP